MCNLSTIRKWKETKQTKGRMWSEKEITQLVQRLLLATPSQLPKAMHVTSLRVEDDLDLGYFDDLTPEQGFLVSAPGNSEPVIRWYEDIHRAEGPWTESDADVADAELPTQVREIKTQAGRSFMLIRWMSVMNATPVKYRVHVSATSSFTADDTNLITTTSGNLVTIKALADGTPLAADTDYYIQVVPEDADGLGPTSAEVTGRIDPEASDDLLVGTVTAEQLEALLVITNTLIAGEMGGSRVELGVASMEEMGGMIGLHAVASDGETITFMVDSADGSVYIKGRVGWGTTSELTVNDIIQIHRQPIGFETPLRVQRTSNRGNNSTASVTWPQPTTDGNLLLLTVSLIDTDASPPTPSTPADWTLVSEVSQGILRQMVWKIEDAASRSGTQNVTLNDTVLYTIDLLEYTGVQVEDRKAEDNGNDAAPSSGTTAATTQNDELGVAFFSAITIPPSTTTFSNTYTNGFSHVVSNSTTVSPTPSMRSVIADAQFTSTGAIETSTTLSDTEEWVGSVVTFKAKTASVPAASEDHSLLYSKDVDGTSVLHAQNESGDSASIALAPVDEEYRYFIITATIDPPNIGPDSGASSTETVTGVLAGDRILSMHDTTGLGSSYAYRADGIVSTNNQVAVRWYKSGAASNPASQTFEFHVLRRKT